MIILASKSPRRYLLLKKILKEDFVVDAFDIDEASSYVLSPNEAVIDVAKRKALECYKHHPNDTIIAADTIVVLNNQIFGKPKNKDDAYQILTKLSGKTHKVITSYTIKNKNSETNKSVVTYVTFKKLDENFINQYIDSLSPMDKAGAYGIQDDAKWKFIKKVKGSINNVIGLPIEELIKDIFLLKIKK